MRANEVFPSRFLTAADLAGRRVVVTIERVFSEEIGGEDRRVVAFVGRQKCLALNRTNWRSIAEITHEDDDDRWAGAAIRLVPTKVDYQGRRVDAVRVEAAYATEQPAASPAAAPGRGSKTDDEAPF